MSVDFFRPFSRLARAAAGAFLGLAALAPAPGVLAPARAAAPQASTSAPSSADGLYQSGTAALAAKDYAAAEESFRRVRELEPHNLRGLLSLAETYLAQNKPEQALSLLGAASATDPSNRAITMALGNTYVRAGQWDQAISRFQKVLDATEKGSKAAGEVYLAMGETYRRKGEPAAAIAALRSARQTLPDDARVLITLAMALDSVSSWEAQQAYEDAVRVAPNNALLLNNLAYSLAEHGGDLDRALSLALRAQQLAPTMPEIADTAGWIYLKKDRIPEARAAFASLVQKDPGNKAFRGHLATALERGGEAGPGLQALAKALRAEPTDANRLQVVELLKSSGLPLSR